MSSNLDSMGPAQKHKEYLSTLRADTKQFVFHLEHILELIFTHDHFRGRLDVEQMINIKNELQLEYDKERFEGEFK